MKEIDLQSWNRRSHYELFGSYLEPCFKIDIRLDVTKLVLNKKKFGGLFLPFLYLLMRASNEYQGMRLRIVDGKVIDYERVHPSFTIDLPDGNFAFCRADYTEDYGEFYENARKSVEQAKLSIEQGDKAHFETNNCADLIYVSCLPWIDFVSVSNPLPYTDKLSMSIPRLNWGKFAKVQDRYETTLSVTFNHALMDGREASYMLLYLEELLRDAEKYLTR